MAHFSIGLDFGTNSVRALVVNVATGEEVGTSVWNYQHGEDGIVLDPKDHNLARQHPADYRDGTAESIREALAQAAGHKDFAPDRVIGIGVDTTGSTPIPVDANGDALALQDNYKDNPAAMAWLWKDHTSHAEAEEITQLANEKRPQYMAKYGGKYSSEWLWSKLLHCVRTAPDVFDAAYTWVELADWVPALLTGTTHPDQVKRCICAAGHKGLFQPDWNGYPDAEFLAGLDPKLARLRETLPDQAYSIADAAGELTSEWADRLGLPAGIPVAVGTFDAHAGAVGSGIEPGVMVKIIGTSTCDLTVAPLSQNLPDIPGLCGIVPESILPGYYGCEAGQSACGDIFNWYVNRLQPGQASHEELTAGAEALQPGESGLLALDWHNGNRTVLVDQRLTGLVLGLTLQTTPAQLYRTWIEATAFGSRVILERFEEYGIKAEKILACGGISVKNPLLMQIYADVLRRPLVIAQSDQTCALGAAMAGAVVAGKDAGGHADFAAAAGAMSGLRDVRYEPDEANAKIYDRLYSLYKRLHDVYGTTDYQDNLGDVMKELLNLQQEVR